MTSAGLSGVVTSWGCSAGVADGLARVAAAGVVHGARWVGSVIASDASAASTAVGVSASSGVLIGSVSGSPAAPLVGSGDDTPEPVGLAGGAGV